MVWKIGSFGYDEPERKIAPRKVAAPVVEKPRQQGVVIAQVGPGSEISHERSREQVENVHRIDNELLNHNGGRRTLLYCANNDRAFDQYIGLPFTKGMTERETGRTMLITGSNAHHGEVMGGQFDHVHWDPENKDLLSYGALIRWINVGDAATGFVGLDYNHRAGQNDGVATSLDDIASLAERLIDFGLGDRKKLFLLQPPHLQESKIGMDFRTIMKYNTIGDYAKLRALTRI